MNGNKKPKFTIDTPRALELLQGKNFYNDPLDCIREIIQNGVDSTLLRIFYESNKQRITFNSFGQTFITFAAQYAITVTIKEDEGAYRVEISDHGMGMKRDQLTYLINTGSSSKNIEKKLMIEKMPDWMRPSGVFGIGFQSIFLVTDKVEIQTKYCQNDEKMAIEMYSPNSPMKGDVYLKKVEGTFDVGMTVKFDIKNSVKMDVAQDPFNAIPKDLKRTIIESKIREYASKSVVPITIKYSADGVEDVEEIQRIIPNYYDEKTGIELYFNPKTFDFNYLGGASYFYRNAKVAGNAEIMFLSPEAVLSGSAPKMRTSQWSRMASRSDGRIAWPSRWTIMAVFSLRPHKSHTCREASQARHWPSVLQPLARSLPWITMSMILGKEWAAWNSAPTEPSSHGL